MKVNCYVICRTRKSIGLDLEALTELGLNKAEEIGPVHRRKGADLEAARGR